MQFILILFIVWRVFLFASAWYSGICCSFNPQFPYSDTLLIHSGLPVWIWKFANFDGVHYLTIASSGYSAQFTQVFFPLYPLLISGFKHIFPFVSSLLLGFLISNISFFTSLVFLRKLLLIDYSKEKTNWIIIFLVFFPTSFYFGSVYTEGFFYLLMIMSFYYARKKSWWKAAIFGGLASATRIVGIFLLPALLIEWYSQYIDFSNVNSFKYIKKIKTLLRKLFFLTITSPIVYIVPLGLVAYMAYLQVRYDDWLYFWHAQPVFGAQRSGSGIILLPQVYYRYAKMLSNISYQSEAFRVALIEVLFTTFALILLIVATIKKMRPAYLIFSWFAILISPLTGTFSSMPRYALIAFPIFIVLGSLKSKCVRILLLTISVIVLYTLTIIFSQGRWVA